MSEIVVDKALGPVIVQGSTSPVFRGPTDDKLLCTLCRQVLVDGYDPRSLIAVNIECYACKSITRTPRWPRSEPLPRALVSLGDSGRFLIGGTVDLKDRAAMTSAQEIERIMQISRPRDQDTTNWELSEDSLSALESELNKLTDGAVEAENAAIERAGKAGNATYAEVNAPALWAIRRIRNALSAGRIDLRGPDGIAMSYIQALRDCLHRWEHHPHFSMVARMLCNEFHHTITAFAVASYLSKHGNQVGVTDPSMHAARSPDLFINTTRNETLSLEVKCPKTFFWPATPPSQKSMRKKIEDALRSAKGQITGKGGGVVILGAGHPMPCFDSQLEQSIEEVIASGRVSGLIAAVVSVSFSGADVQVADGTTPRLTTGGLVHVALNPRFGEPNPVITSKDSPSSRGIMSSN